MNITYGVLNGEPGAEDFLNQGLESLDNVTDVLLFTDGLSIPAKHPERRKDYAPLVKAYLIRAQRVKGYDSAERTNGPSLPGISAF
jgi:hypothetical protein